VWITPRRGSDFKRRNDDKKRKEFKNLLSREVRDAAWKERVKLGRKNISGILRLNAASGSSTRWYSSS
jgi:hypothetical protein